MALTVDAPDVVTLGLTDTEIVAPVAADTTKVVTLLITNITSSAVTFQLHVFDDNGGAGAAADGNALFKSRTLGGNSEEVIQVTVPLTADYTITGLASAASAVNVHVFPAEV